MKYGYHFYDWGLWDIDELLEVKELEEDYITRDCFGEHTFSKDDWVIAKVNDPEAFIHAKYINGKFEYTYSDTGPYYKKNIFDTKEEAEAYARTHSSCFG